MSEPRTWAIHLDRTLRRVAVQYNLEEPFFGAFALSSADGDREYRVGTSRIADERIVDWRHPMAKAFYQDPGSHFRSPGGDYAVVEGTSTRKAMLTVKGRRIQACVVQTPTLTERLVSGPEGFTTRAQSGRSAGPMGELRALLTPAQHRIVSASRNEPLLVRGKAGSGKTSVALHRVAWLAYAHSRQQEPALDPAGVLVLMFNRSLMALTASMLPPLGLDAATVDTFHGWAKQAVEAGYQGVLKIDLKPEHGDPVARGIKKHVGMLSAIDAFVARQTTRVDAFLRERLAPYASEGEHWLEQWNASAGEPVVRRLIRLRQAALAARDRGRGISAQRHAQIHKLFTAAVRRTTLYKEELHKLLTDSALLAQHIPGASPQDLQTLAQNQKALGARDGTARRPGPSVRFEDFALLLRLMQVKNGGLPGDNDTVHRYEHVVIDEVQDFGAVELAVMLGAVQSRTGVTLVGDLNQKIVAGADFAGWEAVAEQLGISQHGIFSLDVAHRSTQPIMALADGLVGDETGAGRAGPIPRLVRTEPERIHEVLAEALFDLVDELGDPHIAVVLRHRDHVKQMVLGLQEHLEGITSVRRGHNKHFEFAPGVTVTNYRQIKGLEFDAVIVVDPDEEHYPANVQGTRNLYTVVTRARDRLLFVATDSLTPKLVDALEAGRLDGPPEEVVPEVELDDLDIPLF